MAAGRSVGYQGSWSAGLPFPARNVWRRRGGLLGMILGVGIALGIGMTMLAVSKASVDLFSADFRDSSAALYVVTEGGTPIPLLAGESPGTVDNARHVMSELRRLPGVTAVVGQLSWQLERERPGPRRRDAPKELFSVMGVDGDPNDIPGSLRLDRGHWPRRSDEIMLGAKLAREKALDIGSVVRLNGRDFRVVGVGRLRGFGFAADSMAYVERDALRQRAPIGDIVNMIAIATTSPEVTRARIDAMDSLSVYSPSDLIRLAEQANQAGVVIRGIMVALVLTVAALFVGNMLGRSVAERRLEFATLQAIGVPKKTILATVAGEALLVCAAAFVFGTAMSLGLGYLLNATVARTYGFESIYSVDAGSFAFVAVLAIGLGLLAGLVPARQATRVDPVEVLREA